MRHSKEYLKIYSSVGNKNKKMVMPPGPSNSGEWSPSIGLEGEGKGHLLQHSEGCFLGSETQTEAMAWGEECSKDQSVDWKARSKEIEYPTSLSHQSLH